MQGGLDPALSGGQLLRDVGRDLHPPAKWLYLQGLAWCQAVEPAAGS